MSTPSNTGSNPAIQDQYDDEFQVCYGCGSKNHAGLQLKSFQNGDRVVATYQAKPNQLGVPGVVYGGLIASLIDCHGIATGAAHFQNQGGPGALPPRCVTASLHVEYRAPTPMGEQPIELSARVEEASARKAIVAVELGVAGQVTAEGRVIAVRIS